MKTKIIAFFSYFLFFVLVVGNATAYSIHNLDFGNIENGKSYEKDLVISLSSKDIPGYFKIDKGGDLAPFLLVTPMEFELDRGQKQVVKISLVPENLEEGNYTGWIIARGQEPISNDGMIAYTVSLKSNIKVSIVANEEKKFSPTIFSIIPLIIVFFSYCIFDGRKKRGRKET